jgi:hypothetical protein
VIWSLRKLRIRRKAVSTMIGGIIVLALFLTALTAMVVVSQQYDTYQNTADKMSQKDIDRFSENLIAINPGLTGPMDPYLPPLSACVSNMCQYDVFLANNGGVAVNIAAVYINTTQYLTANPTQTGCTLANGGPCLLFKATSTPTGFSFSQSDSSISAGEFNHTVRFWLPKNTLGTLPNIQFVPSNSIWVVTTRGRVFSFVWPFPPVGQSSLGGGTPLSIQTGSMKIAYIGTLSSKSDSCHSETRLPLTGPGNVTGYFSFVNPWTNVTIIQATTKPSPNKPYTCTQCFYVSVHSANSLSIPIQFNWGQLVIETANAPSMQKRAFIGGNYFGIVLGNTFYKYGTTVTVQPNDEFYLIFQVVNYNLGSETGSGDAYTGTAVVNNAYSNLAEGTAFRAYTIYLDGLYVRYNWGSGC